MKKEIATFAAGCFWGVEEIFRTIPGVIDTVVGYIGGKTSNPTYEEVCEHTDGHAEAVELIFDPAKISYEKLLDIFFTMHDPTQVNRQGPDVGTNYRSAIFCHSDSQLKQAEKAKESWNKKKYNGKIATQIVKAPTFWRAEEYHQKYFMKRGGGTCHF